jgi:uncharacterized protein
MSRRQVGSVTQLFRYPIKSMLGEELGELEIGAKGVVGDRAWALREQSGRIASAKKWANLFEFKAQYESPPQAGSLAPVRITLPDGKQLGATDSDASAILSQWLGRPVTLAEAHADEHARGEIDPRTVFGEVAVERVMPQFSAATLPDTFGLYRGSFFDSAPIHLLATGSLVHLRSLIGEDAQIDPRRFRPNIVVDTGGDTSHFVEDDWLEGALEIGDSVRIVSMRPALRCVMTTHRQTDLNRDPRVLRAVAQHHRAHLGVFAAIESAGRVRIGDSVWLAT